mmetsp:Transcript_36578/g.27119  ORF Transcript_36578/g.27119 Transcript_36578/m.27119 type:complete len:97 (-) Transcript_36578:12-302(-)
MYRGDIESLKVLLSLRTLREAFYVLEKKWQEFYVERFLQKWLDSFETERDAARKKNKIAFGQAMLQYLRMEPFAEAAVGILVKKEDIITKAVKEAQ